MSGLSSTRRHTVLHTHFPMQPTEKKKKRDPPLPFPGNSVFPAVSSSLVPSSPSVLLFEFIVCASFSLHFPLHSCVFGTILDGGTDGPPYFPPPHVSLFVHREREELWTSARVTRGLPSPANFILDLFPPLCILLRSKTSLTGG